MSRLIDLTGRVFGRLLVIGRADDYVIECKSQIHREPRWICKCSCGNPNPVIVMGSNLKRGHTKSCGCWHKEYTESFGGHNKKRNKYEFCGDTVIGTTDKGDRFIIDKESYCIISPYYWSKTARGYFMCQSGPEGKPAQLHRLIMGVSDGIQLDHINHDKADNRKCNLRIVSGSMNCWNKGLRASNTSGATGVYRRTGKDTWWAEIKENGIRHYLGDFASFDEAVVARKAAEEKYFGPYSYDNSMAAVPRISLVRLAV